MLLCRDEDHDIGLAAICWKVSVTVQQSETTLKLFLLPAESFEAVPRSAASAADELSTTCRFLAFDRHFNLVLADTEEYRKLPPKKGRSEAEVSSCSLRQGL